MAARTSLGALALLLLSGLSCCSGSGPRELVSGPRPPGSCSAAPRRRAPERAPSPPCRRCRGGDAGAERCGEESRAAVGFGLPGREISAGRRGLVDQGVAARLSGAAEVCSPGGRVALRPRCPVGRTARRPTLGLGAAGRAAADLPDFRPTHSWQWAAEELAPPPAVAPTLH